MLLDGLVGVAVDEEANVAAKGFAIRCNFKLVSVKPNKALSKHFREASLINCAIFEGCLKVRHQLQDVAAIFLIFGAQNMTSESWKTLSLFDRLVV